VFSLWILLFILALFVLKRGVSVFIISLLPEVLFISTSLIRNMGLPEPLVHLTLIVLTYSVYQLLGGIWVEHGG
jgi:hypothetical protein